MAKGPMSILTDEQKTKAKDIIGKAAGGGNGEKKMKKEKGDGADAKKEGGEAKKPEDKKSDDKKPDEKKPEEKKPDDAK